MTFTEPLGGNSPILLDEKPEEQAERELAPIPPGCDSQLVNVGCGPFRAPGWTNFDVIMAPELDPPIVPDLLGDLTHGLPLPDASVRRLYLGHVLEHLDWNQVGNALQEVKRVLAPDGEVLVTGPDVMRAIQMYKTDEVDFNTLETLLEDAHAIGLGDTEWEGARHRWNCYAQRIFNAFVECGFEDVVSVGIDNPFCDDWPVVSRVRWQMAVRAKVEPPL